MQPGEKPEGCLSVIIKNMSWETTEETIRSTFEEFGTISRADLDLFTVVDTVDEAYDIITTQLEAGAVDHPGIGL